MNLSKRAFRSEVLLSWRCGVVVTARNEEQVIGKCLASLRNQTVKVFLVVVNDGSVDKTGEIASKYADFVVNLPSHKESWAGNPELASVFNSGFEVLEKENVDYVLISGADTIYPEDHVEEVIRRMRKQKIVLASGAAERESSRSLSPRGSGRILDAKWFKSVGFRYPINYGFEVYLVYKALSEGKKVAVFPDLRFILLRGTIISSKKLYLWGKGMKALNYWWLYALGRAALIGLKHPLDGFTLLKGYLSEVSEHYKDLKEFVPNLQRRMFIKRMYEAFGF